MTPTPRGYRHRCGCTATRACEGAYLLFLNRLDRALAKHLADSLEPIPGARELPPTAPTLKVSIGERARVRS